MEIYYIIAGFILLIAISAFVAYKLGYQKGAMPGIALQEKANALQSTLDDLKMSSEKNLMQTKENYEKNLLQTKEDYEKNLQQTRDDYEKRFYLMMERQEEAIKAQFKVASQEILTKQSEDLSSANKAQLSQIVDPLKEKIIQWEQNIAKVEDEYRNRMSSLDATIKATLDRTEQVGARADRLANALTRENKTQGNFGELRLRGMLLDMGFEEGVQFKEQETMRDSQGFAITSDEGGKRLIPDVMLYFPDGRDIVIDSKISLTAFERYHNAENEEEKELALKDHVKSVRSHVAELAHKDYSKYIADGHQKLDFVVMYMAVEGALQLAITADPNLWKEAYDQGVFITGSQNLYALLRVLDLSWKHLLQVKNQKEIMEEANRMIERTQLLYERLLLVEKQFRDVESAFESVKTVAAPTGPSIITSARKLISYGAKESPKKKSLPKGDFEEKDEKEEQ